VTDRELARSLGAIDVLMTDFGTMAMDRQTADRYDREVPKRKDGEPDRRYRASREWWAYFDRQTKRAADLYMNGGYASDLKAETWR
jgi:hypothetical protein